MLAVAIASVVFGVLEYFQHQDYHKKHPDYEPCPSGIIGFIFIAIVAVYNLL